MAFRHKKPELEPRPSGPPHAHSVLPLHDRGEAKRVSEEPEKRLLNAAVTA